MIICIYSWPTFISVFNADILYSLYLFHYTLEIVSKTKKVIFWPIGNQDSLKLSVFLKEENSEITKLFT